MMKNYKIITYVFFVFVVAGVNGSRLLSNSDSEPTSRELLKSLCERKIGNLFKKCDEAPTPAPKMGKMSKEDKGKGERHRRTVAENTDSDLLMLIETLSSDDKKRVLIAAEEGDEELVNVIFDSSDKAGDLDGRNLLKSLCERKIGNLFKKCDEAPTPAPKMDKMGKEDKGKGKRHRRTLADRKGDDLLALVNNLSSDDKKRVLRALKEGDEDTVNLIFGNSDKASDMDGRKLLKSLCDRKIGNLFKKCDEAPTPAPKMGKMGKEDKGKGKRRRAWEGKDMEDVLLFIDQLSLDDKKRLLNAVESKDEAAVDAMFDTFF